MLLSLCYESQPHCIYFQLPAFVSERVPSPWPNHLLSGQAPLPCRHAAEQDTRGVDNIRKKNTPDRHIHAAQEGGEEIDTLHDEEKGTGITLQAILLGAVYARRLWAKPFVGSDTLIIPSKQMFRQNHEGGHCTHLSNNACCCRQCQPLPSLGVLFRPPHEGVPGAPDTLIVLTGRYLTFRLNPCEI